MLISDLKENLRKKCMEKKIIHENVFQQKFQAQEKLFLVISFSGSSFFYYKNSFRSEISMNV
jgi:hypothetical protein